MSLFRSDLDSTSRTPPFLGYPFGNAGIHRLVVVVIFASSFNPTGWSLEGGWKHSLSWTTGDGSFRNWFLFQLLYSSNYIRSDLHTFWNNFGCINKKRSIHDFCWSIVELIFGQVDRSQAKSAHHWPHLDILARLANCPPQWSQDFLFCRATFCL